MKCAWCPYPAQVTKHFPPSHNVQHTSWIRLCIVCAVDGAGKSSGYMLPESTLTRAPVWRGTVPRIAMATMALCDRLGIIVRLRRSSRVFKVRDPHLTPLPRSLDVSHMVPCAEWVRA